MDNDFEFGLPQSISESVQRDLVATEWISTRQPTKYPEPGQFFLGPERELLNWHWQDYYSTNCGDHSEDIFNMDNRRFLLLNHYLDEQGLQEYFDWISYGATHPVYVLPDDWTSMARPSERRIRRLLDHQSPLQGIDASSWNIPPSTSHVTVTTVRLQPLSVNNNINTNMSHRSTKNANRCHPVKCPITALLTSPFPELSNPYFTPRELDDFLTENMPPGTTFDDLPDCVITRMHIIAGADISLRKIVRRMIPSANESIVSRITNKISMREQRFRNEYGILMGRYRESHYDNHTEVMENRTIMKLERLSEEQLLHQTWGVIDFDNWTHECAGVVFPLGKPRVVPGKIVRTMKKCGLIVPELSKYLEANPRVREKFQIGPEHEQHYGGLDGYANSVFPDACWEIASDPERFWRMNEAAEPAGILPEVETEETHVMEELGIGWKSGMQ